MKRPRKVMAFSLIEVTVAICVFSFGAISIVALLPLAAQQFSDSRDLQVAARLCDGVSLEARHLVPPAAFATFTGLDLVASHDGTAIRRLDPTETAGGRYFLIKLSPYHNPGMVIAPDAPILLLSARISWPFPSPAETTAFPSEPSGREQFNFVFALRP